MKSIFLSVGLFIFSFQLSSAQIISPDSSLTKKNSRLYLGVFYIFTQSGNIGDIFIGTPYEENINTPFSEAIYAHSVSGNSSYSIGFEVERIKTSKNTFASLGLSLESFYYSGTVDAVTTNYLPFPNTKDTARLEYSVRDNFFHLPILIHNLLINKSKSKLNINCGISLGIFSHESNSNRYFFVYNSPDYKPNPLVLFGIVGVDYIYGEKPLFDIGIRATSMLNRTPTWGTLASVGLKVGFFF